MIQTRFRRLFSWFGMAEWRSWSWPKFVATVARGIAWAVDVVAIVVLCFIAQRWIDTAGTMAPAIVGVSSRVARPPA